jgi:hypothetical protein
MDPRCAEETSPRYQEHTIREVERKALEAIKGWQIERYLESGALEVGGRQRVEEGLRQLERVRPVAYVYPLGWSGRGKVGRSTKIGGFYRQGSDNNIPAPT